MAESTVRIEGTVPISSSTPLTISGYVTTTEVSSPSTSGRYIFSLNDVAGTVASNTFVAITNPSGSGKTVIVARLVIGSYTVNTVAAVPSIIAYRATAVSGGTTQAASAIGKTISTYPNAAAVVRTANPAATLGASLASATPKLTGATGGDTGIVDIVAAPAGGGIFLAENESFVVNTASGDVDQRWNITVSWVEI